MTKLRHFFLLLHYRQFVGRGRKGNETALVNRTIIPDGLIAKKSRRILLIGVDPDGNLDFNSSELALA
jgi:hypothetical protein